MRQPFVFLILALVGVTMVNAQQPPPQQPPPQQPSSVGISISGEGGSPPRYAVPDFIALSNDRETQDVAKVIAQVLYDDLDFEREFQLIPRDTYKTIPAAASLDSIPFDRWRELGADGLVMGVVQKTPTGIRVEMHLYSVRAKAQSLGREYVGSAANPRLYAHTMSDEIHQTRQIRGVAKTKLAFASDRNRDPVVSSVEKREVKEIYVSDYDGQNQRRITINRNLNITPNWSPDGKSIAYTSYRGETPDILISNIFAGTMESPTKGSKGSNFLPVFSPDGTKIAFMSNRDGNPEIYVMNRDGSNLTRVTNNPAIDVTPTWSPNGTQLAFTSERTGSPQIYVVGVDGTGLRRISFETHADRPTWSPPPLNEIAFAAKTGPGNDIKILNIQSGETRQITFGEGDNESPSWAPNGRHLAFSSTRNGKAQIFTVDRDGRNLRQITKDGNNTYPNWSQ